VFGSTCENDRQGSEGFAEFFHFRKRETFSCSSRKRVQDDGGVGELLGEIDWSSFWERKLDRLCRDAEGLHERPIAIDGMTMGPVLHADRVVIQVGRSFSRLGEADALPGTGHLGEECAAEEALEVEREIIVLGSELGSGPSSCAEQSPEAPEVFPGKRDGSSKEGQSFEERKPLGVGQPIDPCFGELAGDGRDRGQSVYDIAERTRFQDKDSFVSFELHPIFRVRGDAPAFRAVRRR